MKIETRVESARGCGYRKPGGVYLVSDWLGAPCGKLPIPLTVCPTCHHGIHPARGWTWVDGTKLIRRIACKSAKCDPSCPLSTEPGMVGLIWVGSVFYARPQDFAAEAARMGVSRRVATIPEGFALGKTWVWVAHRQALAVPCPNGCTLQVGKEIKCKKCNGNAVSHTPGVFHAFKPTRIEYVVRERDSEEYLEGLASRGFTLVRVVKDVEALPIFREAEVVACLGTNSHGHERNGS